MIGSEPKSKLKVTLSVENLTCGYPGRPVLSNVTFKAKESEALALLGPNGSGKSTLLKTLAKNLPILAGNAELNGNHLDSLSHVDLARQVAFVPQEEHSHFPFKVKEVVLMGRLAHSKGLMDSSEDMSAATSAMQQSGCAELADRSILELSGGERQRVWIARALAQGARVMLLDEPSSHLDVAHQLHLVKLIEGLCNQGFTILVAVHDLNMASAMADRALLLREGTIGLDASIEETLNSSLLEEVYQVRFERFRDSQGRVRVLPSSML